MEAYRRHLCPALVADCLETIEEIGMRAREIFLSHGGTGFHLVPCLNDHPAWIDAVRQLVEEQIVPPQEPTRARSSATARAK